MNYKHTILSVAMLSLCATMQAVPTDAGRNALARKATTALLVAGLGTKVAELALDRDISKMHLPRKLTTLLTGLLAAGHVGEHYRPGASKVALQGLLASALLMGFMPNASKFRDAPILGAFARSGHPTEHHLRILGIIMWYELAKRGIVWTADKLGLTGEPAPAAAPKNRK